MGMPQCTIEGKYRQRCSELISDVHYPPPQPAAENRLRMTPASRHFLIQVIIRHNFLRHIGPIKRQLRASLFNLDPKSTIHRHTDCISSVFFPYLRDVTVDEFLDALPSHCIPMTWFVKIRAPLNEWRFELKLLAPSCSSRRLIGRMNVFSNWTLKMAASLLVYGMNTSKSFSVSDSVHTTSQEKAVLRLCSLVH